MRIRGSCAATISHGKDRTRHDVFCIDNNATPPAVNVTRRASKYQNVSEAFKNEKARENEPAGQTSSTNRFLLYNLEDVNDFE
jgi:hypothetical protein